MVKILHVINTLAPEGAPILLMSFVTNCNDSNYKNFIAYIYGDGELLKENKWEKRLEVFNLTRNGKFDYFSLFRLIKIIKTKKIDIIHTHLVHAGILGKLAAKLAGVKHIVTTCHYGYHYKENTFLYRLEQRLTGYASVVIAISNSVKKYLIDRNVLPKENIVVIHNAIDLETFNSNRVTRTLQKASNNLVIGSVGRLHPQKGFDTLLESFRLITKQIPNVMLEIVGDGVLHEDLQTLLKKLNVSNKVRFEGAISHQAIIQKLSQWDLFVMSSLWEGFGIAIIEAMALEKPVVATNVEGIVEIVEDGVTGYLVPPKSPAALAQKIIALLFNRTKRFEMGKAGKEKVLNQFSIEQFVEKTKNVYDSLLSNTITPQFSQSDRVYHQTIGVHSLE